MGRALVVTGMHRSGTSLIASAVRAAGVDMGRKFLEPGRGNRLGFFEDEGFHVLHEAMLAFAGHTVLSPTRDLTAEVTDAFVERASTLLAERSGSSLWGWKDPRTCLFLELWGELLPDARYLFVYRHPVEVAMSLLRRDTEPELRTDPWVAISCWEVYNRSLLDLRARHPQRCFLAHVPTLTQRLPSLLKRVAEKLELPLRPVDPAALVTPGELAPTPARRPVDWESLIPRAMGLYRELEACADLPSADLHSSVGAQEEPAGGTVANLDEAWVERERLLLEAGETLLHRLLAERLERVMARPRGELGNGTGAEHRHATDLLKELELTRARVETLNATLTEIQGSRSFAAVDAWWSLRKRMRRRRAR